MSGRMGHAEAICRRVLLDAVRPPNEAARLRTRVARLEQEREILTDQLRNALARVDELERKGA